MADDELARLRALCDTRGETICRLQSLISANSDELKRFRRRVAALEAALKMVGQIYSLSGKIWETLKDKP